MIWGTSGVSEDFGTVQAGKHTKKANFHECVDTSHCRPGDLLQHRVHFE